MTVCSVLNDSNTREFWLLLALQKIIMYCVEQGELETIAALSTQGFLCLSSHCLVTKSRCSMLKVNLPYLKDLREFERIRNDVKGLKKIGKDVKES